MSIEQQQKALIGLSDKFRLILKTKRETYEKAKNELLILGQQIEFMESTLSSVVTAEGALSTLSERDILGFNLKDGRRGLLTAALVELAEKNGGTIKILDVRSILLASGHIRPGKYCWAAINTCLSHSPRFRKDAMGKGTYRLI